MARANKIMEKMASLDVEKELIDLTKQLLAESGEPYKREIKLDASLQSHLGIDSLARSELFQRIEKKFNVQLTDQLLAEAETLNDIAQFLEHAVPGIKKEIHKQKIITSHGVRPHLNPENARTLIDILFLYAENAGEKAHIFFQHEDGQEEVITYELLLQSSLKVANSLRSLGLTEGETVAIMQPTHPGFFYTFFGVLLAGGVPVPIYPPFRMHMLEAYAKTEARILRNAEVRILVTFEQAENLSRLLKAFVPSLKYVTTVHELLQSKAIELPFHARSDHIGFIQYTSGSTADPKGVTLTHYNLLTNIRGYGNGIKVTSDDIAVSWLPLYHDMGLIGMWLGTLYYGVPLVLLTPFSFLNHPERWLWAIHYHRGTISGAPNFAYELCVRKIEPSAIEGLDLSSWRVAANGAEKIYPRTLEQFAKKFAPYKFKRSTLLPVYGLAESTVCLTIPPLGREFRVDHVDRNKFEKELQSIPATENNSLAFVSCGLPIEDHEIRIVNDDNEVLPERHVGNLQFRGPSRMQGYYNNPKATELVVHDGWVDTGDLAYIADGELFITGRRKDLIIKAGRNLYPAEIEELVGAIEGVRQGCVTAFSVVDSEHATEELIVVAETRISDKTQREEMTDKIREVVASSLDIVPDEIILVRPHTVPKTSSGKLQRAACKKMFVEGKLGRKQSPPWLQVSKLGVQWFVRSCFSAIKKLAKIMYTSYVVLILVMTLLIVYPSVFFGSRPFAAKVCRYWAKLLQKLTFCPMTIVNKKYLTQTSPVIYAANHASYIDTIVMLAILPAKTKFIGKKELLYTPIFRTFMRKLEYIPVDRIDLSKGIEDTKHIVETLKAGDPILIFPEGTFSYSKGLRPFRLGAFKVSAETNVPICPIGLKGTRDILRDDERLMRPGKITVTVGEPIQPQGTEWQDVIALRDAVRTVIAENCGEPLLNFIVAQKVAPKKN